MVDIRNYLGTLAMDVIMACAYGIKLNSINNPDHPVIKNAEKVLSSDVNFNRLTSIIFPKLACWMKLNFFDVNATDFMIKLAEDMIVKRKKLNEQFGRDPGTFNTLSIFS